MSAQRERAPAQFVVQDLAINTLATSTLCVLVLQGLVAGVNAARRAQALEPVVFPRNTSYIGTLIDDLVTKVHVESTMFRVALYLLCSANMSKVLAYSDMQRRRGYGLEAGISKPLWLEWTLFYNLRFIALM